MKEVILAYQGEMALKGLNRQTFEAAVMKSVRLRLSDLGSFSVSSLQSTVYIEPQDDSIDMDEALLRVKKIFGFAAVSRAAVCEKNFDSICETAKKYLDHDLSEAHTFKVSAKRSDKTFPLNSMQIDSELGGVLLDAYPNLRVDVHDPECIVFVEIRDLSAYVHAKKEKGAGGMPVGTSGRAGVLISGGIDSPVAAWMMAKRGLAIQGIHFASPPYTGERAKQKVVDLCRQLRPWTGPFNLFVVPFAPVQVYIRDNGVPVLFTVLMRRSMMRIAYAINQKTGAEALVTGESLAQVASQTLKAIACTDPAQPSPVFRPLIGMDKCEITEISHRIGTYEISILPYEDCCTIFTPPHPKTRPSLDEILAAEKRMPELMKLEAAAAESAERIRI